eukprot:1122677-Pleurochrysis_carterae.AAC.1
MCGRVRERVRERVRAQGAGCGACADAGRTLTKPATSWSSVSNSLCVRAQAVAPAAARSESASCDQTPSIAKCMHASRSPNACTQRACRLHVRTVTCEVQTVLSSGTRCPQSFQRPQVPSFQRPQVADPFVYHDCEERPKPRVAADIINASSATSLYGTYEIGNDAPGMSKAWYTRSN